LPLWIDATIYPGEYHDVTVSILCFNAEISWMSEAKANRSLDDVFKELNDGAIDYPIYAAVVKKNTQLQAELDKLKKDRDYDKEHYIFIERPEFPCKRCGGRGSRAYGNTSTWRGGIGGNMITGDVCDSCWGTGDAENKGPNLRVLYMQLKGIEYLRTENKRLLKCEQDLRGIYEKLLEGN